MQMAKPYACIFSTTPRCGKLILSALGLGAIFASNIACDSIVGSTWRRSLNETRLIDAPFGDKPTEISTLNPDSIVVEKFGQYLAKFLSQFAPIADSTNQKAETAESKLGLEPKTSGLQIFRLTSEPCDGLTSCSTCATNPQCQWCSAQLAFETEAGVKSTMHMMGVCRPKTIQCSSVQFGHVGAFLSNDMIKMMLGIVIQKTIAYSVATLTNSGPDAVYCTAAVNPKMIAEPDCAACTKLGNASQGWCDFGVTLLIEILNPKPVEVPGGLCIPAALSFLCNKDLVPKLPSFAGIDPTKAMTFWANWVTATGKCAKPEPPPAPKPSTTCSDNLSCKTCSAGCTWCGGHLSSSSVFLEQTMSVNVNIFGVCLQGDNVDCLNVKFGTLPEWANHLPPKKGSSLSFKVERFGASDALCTTVAWPRTAASPCKDCAGKVNTGWCQMTSAVTQESTVRIEGGICLTNNLNFLCTLAVPGTMSSKWITESDTCPNDPIYPVYTTTTTAITSGALTSTSTLRSTPNTLKSTTSTSGTNISMSFTTAPLFIATLSMLTVV